MGMPRTSRLVAGVLAAVAAAFAGEVEAAPAVAPTVAHAPGAPSVARPTSLQPPRVATPAPRAGSSFARPLVRHHVHVYGDKKVVSPFRVQFSITTPEEHDLYIESHRLRIDRIAKEIVRQNPERYKHVDVRRLQRAALAHDQIKVERDPRVLARYGFTEPPRETLVKLWGKPASSTNGLSDDAGGRFFAQLTAADHDLEREFTTDEIEIVNLADKIDKGSDPVPKFEELGRTGQPASVYLRNTNHRDYDPVKSPQLADMAARVERVLDEVVPDHLQTLNYVARRKAELQRPATMKAHADTRAK